MNLNHHPKLLIMSILSFISMYILMYSMVNSFENFYNNFNKVYMAAIMTAPMVIIALTVMRGMYSNKQLNLVLLVVSIVALAGFFLFIRQQTGISDKQFLRSMIPHHSSAILMCERALIQDQEIRTLCETIVETQQEEINQMGASMQRLENAE